MFPDRSYFFDGGIRFGCRRCGTCCTGAPGVVRLNSIEMDAIAEFLGVAKTDGLWQFISLRDDGLQLIEHRDGRCVFFDHVCRIYPVRPTQCRTFPFWFSNCRSEDRWQEVARSCPGNGHGPRVDRETIIQRIGKELAG